eukprot:TRINITY_DN1006_c0_g1_i5.p2 TRINITY_DN1006_c0_g1~~TRINITY_DN1006_c0_g1_i5.p2  ORF type:complete len:212 (+),score=25.89 TRINITY_DN1006_c0_g1_i5:105-740(+)
MVTRKCVREINRLSIKERARERLLEFRKSAAQENFNRIRNIQTTTNTEQVKAAVQNAQQEQQQQQQRGCNSSWDESLLSEEEQEIMVQELMREMVEQNYEELLEYEQGSSDNAAQDMLMQQESMEAGEILMPCPVCQCTYLQECNNLVGCPMDEFYLQTSIKELQTKLNDVLCAHYNNGCMGSVHFAIDSRFSSTNLTMTCESCGCCVDVI